MKQILLVIIIIFNISGFVSAQTDYALGWNNFTDEMIEKPEMKIYPNPCVQQKITIEIYFEELAEVRITNITGKVVMLKKFEISVNNIELTLHNIPDGVYLVQIKTSEKKILAQKLIVSGK